MITCLFFASVKEEAGTDRIELDAEGINDVSSVIATLGSQSTQFADALARENLLIAVNQTMVDSRQEVGDGDEVAFFPPVTGG